MSSFSLACQTITWGGNQKDMLPQVFPEVRKAGFEAVEIGFRHIRETPPARILEMLEAEGLALAASHVGGNLFDSSQADQERGLLDEAISYLKATDTALLMYSGLRYESDEQLAQGIDMLNRAAEKCVADGITLLYHNHNWEFESGGRVIEALLTNGCDALGFCPDVGWVMKGGEDAVSFLGKIKPKLGAVHFKDFATRDPGCDTVVLGQGVAPLVAAADWLKHNVSGLYVIAEQDNADVPAAEAAAGNAAFLNSLFS